MNRFADWYWHCLQTAFPGWRGMVMEVTGLIGVVGCVASLVWDSGSDWANVAIGVVSLIAAVGILVLGPLIVAYRESCAKDAKLEEAESKLQAFEGQAIERIDANKLAALDIERWIVAGDRIIKKLTDYPCSGPQKLDHGLR